MKPPELPPTGWADVATRQDLDHVEARIHQRFDQLEARIDHVFEELREDLRVEFAASQRRIIQWNVGTMIAAVAATTAILRLS